jgi:hypothetical protein
MIKCDRTESRTAFLIVTVTYAHQLGTILAQEIVGSLLDGYDCAFGSHSLLSRSSWDGLPKK